MTGRLKCTRETQGRTNRVRPAIMAPSECRAATLALFTVFSLSLAAVPLSGAWAQSRDGQLRFPGADSYPATPGLPSQPVDGASADSGTTVIGGAGSGVSVDFSVLDTLDRARGRELLFPDPNFRGNRERVELTPPGNERVTLTPPGQTGSSSQSATRAAPKTQPPSPDIQAARPAPKPSAPERMAPEVPPSTASAPPPPNTSPGTGGSSDVAKADPAPMAPKAESTPEPKAEAKPEPKAAPEPARETASAPPEPATPPPPAFDRNAVPPPPVAAEPKRPAGSGTTAEVPPVDAAPRTGVTQQKMQPPQPPAASQTSRVPEQTAALPPTDTAWTPGQTRVIDFPAGNARLPDNGQETLKAAAKAVAADEQLRVELKAYAAGDANSESQARRLSLSRALSVRSFLIREGVQSTRIDVRALGNRVSGGEPDRVDVTVVSR